MYGVSLRCKVTDRAVFCQGRAASLTRFNMRLGLVVREAVEAEVTTMGAAGGAVRRGSGYLLPGVGGRYPVQPRRARREAVIAAVAPQISRGGGPSTAKTGTS